MNDGFGMSLYQVLCDDAELRLCIHTQSFGFVVPVPCKDIRTAIGFSDLAHVVFKEEVTGKNTRYLSRCPQNIREGAGLLIRGRSAEL